MVTPARTEAGSQAFLPRRHLGALIDQLQTDGRRVIGPTLDDGAISYREIQDAGELPVGWHDLQGPGYYRLTSGGEERAFSYASTPQSWKRSLFPSLVPIERQRRDGRSIVIEPLEPEAQPLAFLGVRACDLAAMRIQDRVLRDGPVRDGDYAARRSAALVVAVQCTRPAATCFCTSMGTGPEVGPGADLVLTELSDGFLVEARSPAGADLLDALPTRRARVKEVEEAAGAVAAARGAMGQGVETDGLAERLLDQLDHPHWAEVAERCLGCTNCTLVCPTCFCTSIGQRSDLSGQTATSERRWASCFEEGFARVAGGDFRSSRSDRYRQWLTHKFGTWLGQFGTLGCVGCGRCITWCPVGIDVREELAAIAGPVVGGLPPAPPSDTAIVATAAGGAPAHTSLDAAATPADSQAGHVISPLHTEDRAPVQVAATIQAVVPETADTVTMIATDVPATMAAGRPGQFLMVGQPAFPAVPISVSRFRPGEVALSIRAAGPATAALSGLQVGHQLTLRGPLGRGWPLERAHGRDVVVVAGGIGLAPIRPVIDAVLAERQRFRSLRVFYGARTPADRLYVPELAHWAARSDLELHTTVDRAGPGWSGPVGVVTQLFDQAPWDGRDAAAFVCGPERMMLAAVETLLERGVHRDRIFVSMERHMECGVGLCGHCQLGGWFVCHDGPVFSIAELGDAFGREGI